MPQLGRIRIPVQDTNGTASVSASVKIYREGATVNDNQSGTSPKTFNVHNNGKIVAGDTVFINTTTGTTYSVDSVTDTTAVLSGFAGSLALTDGDRIIPSNNLPTLYSEDQGVDSTGNPLTSDSTTGVASAHAAPGAYDIIASGGTPAITATLYEGFVAHSEFFAEIRDVTQFADADGAQADLPSGGGVIFIPQSYAGADITTHSLKEGVLDMRNSTGPHWSKMNEIVYAKAFGATGDGSTDDTTAAQAALDNAGAGTEVYFEAGTYIINTDSTNAGAHPTSGGLAPANNTTIRLHPNATLKAKDSSADYGNVIRLNGLTNIRIMGGTIDGNRAGYSGSGEWGMGIGIFGCTGVRITNITVKNCWGDNIFIDTNTASGDVGNPPSEVYMEGVICENCRRNGLTIIDAIHSSFVNCTFKDTNGTSPQAGVDLAPFGAARVCRTITFTGCIFDNNTGSGFNSNFSESSTSGGLTLTGCTSRSNAGAGIVFGDGTSDSTIVGCTSDADGGASTGGILLNDNNSSCSIIGCAVRDSVGNGILAQGTPAPLDCVISGNVVADSAVYGIRVIGGDGCIITSNTVLRSQQAGLRFNALTNSIVSNNYCDANSQVTDNTHDNISVVTNSTNNVFSGNVCRQGSETNDPRYGIAFSGSSDDNFIFGNDFLSGGQTGAVNESAVNRYRDNIGWTDKNVIPALANDATPSVLGVHKYWLTGGTTTITDFDDGQEGQEITIISEHSISIVDGTNIFLSGSTGFAMNATDTLTLIQKSDGKWYEKSRSDNS